MAALQPKCIGQVRPGIVFAGNALDLVQGLSFFRIDSRYSYYDETGRRLQRHYSGTTATKGSVKEKEGDINGVSRLYPPKEKISLK